MTNEIVLYQPNDQMSLEVKLENETVWLTQQQIADLFGVKRPAVTKHLGNIFRAGELDVTSVSSISPNPHIKNAQAFGSCISSVVSRTALIPATAQRGSWCPPSQ